MYAVEGSIYPHGTSSRLQKIIWSSGTALMEAQLFTGYMILHVRLVEGLDNSADLVTETGVFLLYISVYESVWSLPGLE